METRETYQVVCHLELSLHLPCDSNDSALISVLGGTKLLVEQLPNPCPRPKWSKRCGEMRGNVGAHVQGILF